MDGLNKYGAPGEIRTPDLMVRSHALYPTELRALSFTILPRDAGTDAESNGGERGIRTLEGYDTLRRFFN